MSKLSLKRPAHQQQKQATTTTASLPNADEQYDDYLYYGYQPRAVPEGGYEYVPDTYHDATSKTTGQQRT
jgi:hypothetical protein